MAIRQYIGARYVPRFMGTYDATQQYEVLDVVDNGLGTSYVLKKPAPVGTPLTDTEYWILYGASSGAIINLQNQIDTINNTDIPVLQGQIDTINDTDLPAVNGKIGTLSNLKTPVKTDIVNAINSTLDRKVICISDSYGTYPDASNNWMASVKNFMGLDNDHFWSRAYSGSGFATGGETFQQQLENIASGLISQQKLEITDIVVGGGFNDAQNSDQSNTTGVLKYIADFATYAKSTFPNAKLHIAFIASSFNSEWLSRIRAYNCLVTYQLATLYGFDTYVVNSENILKGKNLFTQEPQGDTPLYLGYFYGHPNAGGANSIAIAIINHLNHGGGFRRNHPQYALITPTLASGVSLLTGSSSFYMEQNGDKVNVIKDDLGNTVFGFSTNKDITGGMTIEIGTMNDGFVAGIDSSQSGARPLTQMPFNGVAWQTDTGWLPIQGEILFMNNRMYLRVIHPQGTSIESISVMTASGCFPAYAC